jgi:hypothetical protein
LVTLELVTASLSVNTGVAPTVPHVSGAHSENATWRLLSASTIAVSASAVLPTTPDAGVGVVETM